MKKCFAAFLCAALLLCGCVEKLPSTPPVGSTAAEPAHPQIPADISLPTDGPAYHFYASENGYFYRNDGGTGTPLYIQGVNMGLTEADTDLNNPNVSYETYLQWFAQIRDMNANTVRAFTVMNPNFYRALYDYNVLHPQRPLYLIQGIWFSEDLMYQLTDALESDQILINAFKRSVRETIDIVHGNSDYTVYGEFSPAIYDKDISQYVIGYILGLEYPAEFVIETNASHPDEADYEGTYLYTAPDAAPFEAFLCEVGETLIAYETDHYAHQTPVAFLNWQTLDVLEHPNEPFEEEDAVSVNTENIRSKSSYVPNQFAAMDVYPYYPEFMNHQQEYLDFRDENGDPDPYRAYLRELRAQYTMPVLVAEYGLSTARGKAHLAASGYDQGGLTEQEQGHYLAQMTQSILLEGYCGGLVFSWQDEWFKRTWNAEMYYPRDPTQRTHNLASAEQGYGLVSFEVSTAYPDGAYAEWKDIAYIEGTGMKVQYDADYMHIYIELPAGFDFERDTYYVPISVLGIGSEYATAQGLRFDRNADFLLEICGREETRLLCDEYYDLFGFKYGVLKQIYEEKADPQPNSGRYCSIQTYVSNDMYLPVDQLYIGPKAYESGLLRFGNGNPNAQDFCSQADFYYADGKLEIRLAWYLLNVANVRQGICMAPFTSDRVEYADITDIYIGGGQTGQVPLHPTAFSALGGLWTRCRLKQSYYILQEAFATLPYTQ